MGIDVDANRVVRINPGHQQGVDTEATNPIFKEVAGCPVALIFARKNHPNQLDGNPLAYALKGLNKYSIDDQNQKLLTARVLRMIPLCFPNTHFDHVMAVPSSSGVAMSIARAVKNLLPPITLLSSGLRKVTNVESLEVLVQAKERVPERDRREYDTLISRLQFLSEQRPGGAFQMKDVKHQLRGFFRPIVQDQNLNVADKSILLTDDLLSSGGSLSSAIYALFNAGAAEVRGMVLLGPTTLDPRVRR